MSGAKLQEWVHQKPSNQPLLEGLDLQSPNSPKREEQYISKAFVQLRMYK